MTDKDLMELKEIALEVDKLIKYAMEMKTVTRYGDIEQFNIQKLSLWSYNIKYRKE